MKQTLIVLAQGVVWLVGIAALLACIILLPELAREEAVGKPDSANMTIPFLAGAYILAIPFFVGLYQTLKLLSFIGNNKAFSKRSIRALQNIKLCAIIFSVMVVIATIAGMGVAKFMDPGEDVTFMVPIGFILVFVASVIAVFVAVLQKLLADAIPLKSENDLIV